ncbi:putative tail length tape measure protein [plant metagenome]|uniref:Putative tail length tape measure protein n=1 Tax=plant metagenome TaxID=1297885 RepID=A0A484U2G8_9ZZZZ
MMTVMRELVTMLRYQVDNSGLRQYQATGTGIVNRMRRGLGAVRDIGLGVGEGLRDGLRDALGSQNALNEAQQQSTQEVKKTGQEYSRLGNIIRTAMALLSVRQIVNWIDSWGQMEARMKQATASAEEYANADKELARISRLTYKSYNDNAELFVRTRRVMSDLGKSTQDTIDLTEAMSLGMALSSTAADKQGASVDALSKSIMQGKIGTDQFQTIQAGMPRLFTALADGLGMNTVQLNAYVKAGKLTTEKMLPALQSQLAKMRVEAEDMPVTVNDAMTVMNDAAQRFFGKTLTIGRRAILATTRTIEFLADNIEDVAKAIALLGATWAINSARVALAGAAASAGGLLAAIRNARIAAVALALPLLKIAAILATIYLVGQDILVWLEGGDSLLGRLVGGSEEWRTQLDAIMAPAKEIGSLLNLIVLEIGRAVAGQFEFANGFEVIVAAVKISLTAILAVFAWWLETGKHFLAAFLAVLRGDWDEATEHIIAGIKSMAQPLIWLKDQAIDVMKSIGNAIEEWIMGKLDKAKKAIASVLPDVSGITDRASNWASDVANRGRALFGIAPAQAQVAGATAVSQVVNNDLGGITVNAPGADPASVGRAAQTGAGQAMNSFGVPFGPSIPMVEASP